MVLVMSDSVASINTMNHGRRASGTRNQGYMGTASKRPGSFDPEGSETPTSLDTNHFRWWADDAASTLKSAIDVSCLKDESGDSPPDPYDDPAVEKIIGKICNQLAKQVSNSAYNDVTCSLRAKMQILERACQTLIREDQDKKAFSPGQSDVIATRMEHIIMRRLPEEIVRWIAIEIHSLLMNEEASSDEFDDNFYMEAFEDVGLPSSESDTQLGRWTQNHRYSPSTTPNASTHRGTRSEVLDTRDMKNVGPKLIKYEVGADDFHRKFYNDDLDPKLQHEAFKKFLLVLVRGRGFRVVKHNHGGGRKSRILKYNTQRNRIYWESSRILGRVYLDCKNLTRIDREENVVYVWHQVGRNNKKKMMGFETQREYDARVLQLALLYLYNQNTHMVPR